jgi:protein SCO1/2
MMLFVSIMLCFPGTACAATRLHGVVLAVSAKDGTAVVRHDPFGAMPAMTMPFRIVPRARAAQLQAGATIDAEVDTTTEPWTLRNVVSTAAEPLTDEAASPLRRVTSLRVGDRVPEVASFVDQRGRPFRFSALRGQDVVLAFIYTRCQDARMCPLISAKFRALQDRAGHRALQLVEVSLDPAYDRPPVLRRYGQIFGQDPRRWSLVVGDADPTLDFAARFGIGAIPDPQIGIIHSENTVTIDRTGHIAAMRTDTAWTPDELLAQIDALDGHGGNALQRFDLWLKTGAIALCGNAVAGFSGLTDLIAVVVVLAAFAYLLYRLARKIFLENA